MVNGDSGTVEDTFSVSGERELITTQLLNDALGCAGAYAELVDRYGELSEEERLQWHSSLSGAQEAALYYAATVHSEGISGALLSLVMDTDTANTLVQDGLKRISEAFGIDTSNGAAISEEVKLAALSYLDELVLDED